MSNKNCKYCVALMIVKIFALLVIAATVAKELKPSLNFRSI